MPDKLARLRPRDKPADVAMTWPTGLRNDRDYNRANPGITLVELAL